MSSTSSTSTTSAPDVSSWWDWIPDWLLDYNSFEETENVDFFSIGIVAGYTLGISFLLWIYWTCECHQSGCTGVGIGESAEVMLAGAPMGAGKAKRRDCCAFCVVYFASNQQFDTFNTSASPRPFFTRALRHASAVPGVSGLTLNPYLPPSELSALQGTRRVPPLFVATCHEHARGWFKTREAMYI